MKQITLLIILLLFNLTIHSQIGVGNTDPKAILDISAGSTASEKDGILIPRLDEFPTGVNGDQDGMMVFLTGDGTPSKGFYYWDNSNTIWIPFTGGAEEINELNDGKTGGNSLFLGLLAGQNDDASNNRNTGVGFNALRFSVGSTNNTAVGFDALRNTTGGGNTAIGSYTMDSNSTGFSNVAIGNFALRSITSGQENVAVGNGALFFNEVNYNTAIGAAALYNTSSGTNNTALGYFAGHSNITGNNNVSVGRGAGQQNVNGSGNIKIGVNAGNTAIGDNKLFIQNSNADENNALIYGEFDNDILRTNGQLQIGNPAGMGYSLPTLDGIVGQVMTTDGSGNVSFQNVTGTDDQNLLTPTLTGTTLNLNIENGSSTSINLASLQDGNGGTLDDAYDFGGAGNGNTIIATDGAVTIDGEDGLLVQGTHGSGATIVASTSSSRMFFNPRKSAFRAGRVNTVEWDETNVGFLSVAFGQFTRASGDISTAFGSLTRANGDVSTAFGSSNQANGTNSFVFGNGNVVNGDYATAFGDGNNASGLFSTAFGQQNNASGELSTAFGTDNIASQTGATAFGNGTQATSQNSTSFGLATTASGTNSTAFGNNTTASGGSSTAFNAGNVASGLSSTAFGVSNTAPSAYETTMGTFATNYTPTSAISYNTNDRIFTVGNGTNNSYRSNALTIYKSGIMNINDAYNMPLTDGSTGQVLTTDGGGNVSFQNASVNTDNQNLLTPVLTGTTLNIGIEDGTGASINLSSLQDGTGTDNQNLLTPTLTGTTLSLSIEDGTGTSINLASLQDGTGTDNQTIDTFSFNSVSNILTLEVENDGIPAQMVNLSALDSGGDVTAITAGPGLTGGGTAGAITLNASANNGITVNAAQDRIQLGGSLIQDTEVTFGTRDIRWNLDNSGDFIIQDAGVNKWEINSGGDEVIGGGSFWRQTNTAGLVTATLTSASNIGTLSLRNTGATRTLLTGSGDSYFNGGKVGIGETNPDGYLEILANNTGTEPNINLVDLGSDGARINFTNTTTTNNNVWTLYGDTNNTPSNSIFNLFHQNTGNIITARGDGRVGVMGDPVTDFHVYHDQGSNSRGFRLENEPNNTWWRFYVFSGGDLNLFSSAIGNTTPAGTFNNVNGAYTTISDRRLKKDFEPLHFDWTKFMKLESLSYRFKTQTNDEKSIGFIAQDLEPIYPELISQDAEGGMYKLNYSGLGVVAIKAVQELKKEVNVLSFENAQLKQQLSKYENLERRLMALENQNFSSSDDHNDIAKINK